MKKITIYHNPRCSKSRKSIEILNSLNIKYNIIEYLKTPLGKGELTAILDKLKVEPIDIIRTNEEEFKLNDIKSNDRGELIELIIKYPKILQRPIISTDKKAVIGRPPENIKKLFSQE